MIEIKMTLKELLSIADMSDTARNIVNSLNSEEWSFLEDFYEDCDFEGLNLYDDFVSEMENVIHNARSLKVKTEGDKRIHLSTDVIDLVDNDLLSCEALSIIGEYDIDDIEWNLSGRRFDSIKDVDDFIVNEVKDYMEDT